MSDEPRTLVLLRHAKSDYPDDVADHDRPLAPRGEREAALAGDWLRSAAVDPTVDAVLCSTATRTRQTLARTGIEAPVHYAEELYGATPGAIITAINAAETTFGFAPRSLLVIGHEPAMSGLALGLADRESGKSTAAEDIAMKYPTSALALLRFDGPWSRLEPGSASLLDFHVPR